MTELIAAADIGGTHFRVATFESESLKGSSPETLVELIEKVGEDRSPQALVERLSRTLEEAAGSRTIGGLGIAFAGMMSNRDGLVERSPHFGWRNVPLGELVRSRFPRVRSIVVENDVNATTLGEASYGAARGCDHVLGVFGGTGVGGGLVLNGMPYSGPTGSAAEIGHTKVDLRPQARKCGCSKRGCLEAYVGGACIIERVRDESEHAAASLCAKLAGSLDQVRAVHIDQAARQGDSYCLELWSEASRFLGATLANAATLLNPQCLVLGGGTFERCPDLLRRALEHFEELINPPARPALTIVHANLGHLAGPLGVAKLATRRAES